MRHANPVGRPVRVWLAARRGAHRDPEAAQGPGNPSERWPDPPTGVPRPRLLLLTATGVSAQEPGRRSAPDVHLRIETDRSTYRVGDSIAMRLSLRNVSPIPVRFVTNPPVVQARLRLCDEAGREVEPAFPRAWQRLASKRPATLTGGGRVTLEGQNREWLTCRTGGTICGPQAGIRSSACRVWSVRNWLRITRRCGRIR